MTISQIDDGIGGSDLIPLYRRREAEIPRSRFGMYRYHHAHLVKLCANCPIGVSKARMVALLFLYGPMTSGYCEWHCATARRLVIFQHKWFSDHFTSNPITFREYPFNANVELASFRERDMDKESTLKSAICNQLIFRVIVARATYEGGEVGMWADPWLR